MGSGTAGEISIQGRRLSWRVAGEGPSLLLINGYAATSADWDPTFLTGLGESFEVICPDNRGVGGSEAGTEELSIDDMADDMVALLDALEIESAVVVGWSMGGFVAQRLAARAPGRVSALALLSTDPGGPDSTPAAPDVWARLVDHSGAPREQAARLIALLFPPKLATEIDRRFGDVVAAARARLSRAVLQTQEAAMETWHRDGQSVLREGDAPPTLIVHGGLDVVIPPANAAALGARFPGAGVEVIEGCGHAVMAQEPQRVVAAVRQLLEG